MTKNIPHFIILFILMLPIGADAKPIWDPGKHLGEEKFIEYSIEYLEQLGVTEVHVGGITFSPYGGSSFTLGSILPEKYFGEYSLYFNGGKVPFCVIIKNKGARTFRNLLVETFQEYLNVSGGKGEAISDANRYDWFLEELKGYEEVRLCGTYTIPLVGSSGIDQTHLKISHESSSDGLTGKLILEDYQAGLWCPII